MTMSFGSKLHLPPGSWMEFIYDVIIGIVTGAYHSMYLSSRNVYMYCIRPILALFLKFSDGDESQRKKEEKLKVVAVGYGRTGTYSLTLALEELGFPTLHTQHLYENAKIMDMWTNDIFLPSIQDKKARMGKPDLSLITSSGFTATADLPLALYFEQVMEEYPDCKFILTTRENSEVWFRSWDTLTRSITQPAHLGGFFFTNVKQYTYYLRWLLSVVGRDDSYLTQEFPLSPQNKEFAILSYEEHNRNVRAKIPADRLLEYNVRQGWDPLCDFLEIADCPSTPFPKTNSARSVQVQSISAFLAPICIVLFCIFYGVAAVFHRVTGKNIVQWMRIKRKRAIVNFGRMMRGEKVAWWGVKQF